MKKIPGFKNKYSATEDGKIFSYKRMRFLKQRITPFGYATVSCNSQNTLVHRLVALAFLGKSKKKTINHKDGNKLNNNVSNLEWATHKENTRHAITLGLVRYKERKINYDEAVSLYSQGLSHKKISQALKCSRTLVSYIIRSNFSKKTRRAFWCKNLSKAGKGRPKTYKEKINTSKRQGGRPILVYQGPNIIGRYDTVVLASESLGVSENSIRGHLKGKYKHFGGYTARWD